MFVSFGILVLTTTIAAAEHNHTLYQLRDSCEKLTHETFRRETANDENRVDYRAHYNAGLNTCFYATESNLRRISQVYQYWPFLLQR